MACADHQNIPAKWQSWVPGIIGSYETLASSALAGALNMARCFVLGNRQKRFERFEMEDFFHRMVKAHALMVLPRVTFSTVWIRPFFTPLLPSLLD